MKTDGHFELDDALAQLKKLPRATPPPGLLGRIEARLGRPEAKTIPLKTWRMYAAAACLLLALNGATLSYAIRNSAGQATSYDTANGTLISDFQLYE